MNATLPRLLPCAARRATAWKNGLGTTIEIARDPPGAGFADFDWRISRAQFEHDSPFSAFPGVDRVLVVLSGELELQVASMPSVRLDVASAPYAFAGDVPATGRVLAGPIEDLNVMTARARVAAVVERLSFAGSMTLPSRAGCVVVYCVSGASTVSASGGQYRLDADDGLWLPDGGAIRLASMAANSHVVVITLTRRAGAS